MDYLNYNQVNLLRQKQKELRHERFLEDCRRRLDKIISKKIETTFIGAVASFEKYFGFLWGQEKDERDLTREEIQLDKLWEQCRNEILNKGNKNLRAAQDEISNHIIEWKKHKLVLPVKEQ